MSELLPQLSREGIDAPPMQKLFVTGNILPGTDLSPDNLSRFVEELSTVTGMNLFGETQIKTPDHYDQHTLRDLGGAPEDINVSWMWDDSGGQLYVFPSHNYWTTIDLHTCKEFDSAAALDFIARYFNFRENMQFAEQGHSSNTEWTKYATGQQPELEQIGALERILNTDIGSSDELQSHGQELESIAYRAIRERWGNRLASVFDSDLLARIREVHGAYEVAEDDAFMDKVLSGLCTDPSEYPFQPAYDRLALMEADLANLKPGNRVLHIGTGWPGTAIGIHRQIGSPVTCVEIDREVAIKSKQALEKLGLYGKDKVQVVVADGCEVDPTGYRTIIVSAMVPTEDKLRILNNIKNTSYEANDHSVLLRSPADRARSLFYQPLPQGLPGNEVAVTTPGDQDPLRSHLFKLGVAPGVKRGEDAFVIRTQSGLKRPIAV